MRNIFLEICTKCGGEISLDPFLTNQNLAYLWTNSLKFYTVNFYMSKSKAIDVVKLRCRPLAFTSYEVLKKQKDLELVSLPEFLHDF